MKGGITKKELKLNKNLQHIRRVINKGVLTSTEKGKFYIFQNPDHSSCLTLVPWGVILPSTVGSGAYKIITKQEREILSLPNFQLGEIVL